MEIKIEKIIDELEKDKPVKDDAKKLKEKYASLFADWQEQLNINQATFISEFFKYLVEEDEEKATAKMMDKYEKSIVKVRRK